VATLLNFLFFKRNLEKKIFKKKRGGSATSTKPRGVAKTTPNAQGDDDIQAPG
jgi:hypothetical protein